LADEKILITAAAYLNCAFEITMFNLMKINQEIIDYTSQNRPMPGPETAKTIVKTVDASFACELALKSMLPKGKGHKLDDLFKRLRQCDETAASSIKRAVIMELGITEEAFIELLGKCNDNFEFYRYYFEGTDYRTRDEQLDKDGYRFDHYKFVKVLTQQILIYNGRRDLIEELQDEYIQMTQIMREKAKNVSSICQKAQTCSLDVLGSG